MSTTASRSSLDPVRLVLRARHARAAAGLGVAAVLLAWLTGNHPVPFPVLGSTHAVPVRQVCSVLVLCAVICLLTPRVADAREVRTPRDTPRWERTGTLAVLAGYAALLAVPVLAPPEGLESVRNAAGLVGLGLLLRPLGRPSLCMVGGIGYTMVLLTFGGDLERTPVGWPLHPADSLVALVTATTLLLAGLVVGTRRRCHSAALGAS